MDAPLKEDDEGSSTLYDILQNPEQNNPERELILESLRGEILRSLNTLKVREADVIRLYYGLDGSAPMTLAEIGERFDLTRERVRQIKEKGIRKLKNASRSRILKASLG
jgi:RNA polymerase primary sigma factor